MATVGSLFINVKARTASFSKKMKGVRGTVARMAKGFGRMAKKVGKFAAVLGGVALAAIIAFTKAGLASVDMVTKLALSMNTGTEGIIALQHAAKIGGVSVEKMDKAIGKMFKNVGEAEMGVGMAKRTLDEMGLSAEALGKMEADEMFGAIAEELTKVTSASKRARMANDLFGRSGIELIPVMLEGAEGIRKLREEADELGITFGSKQGQLVEKANDAWARVGSIWKGLTQQLAIQFAPILIEIANRIKSFVINAGGMAKVAEGIVKAFFYAGAAVLDVIKAIQIGWLGFKASVIQGAAFIVDAMAWSAQKSLEVWTKALGALQTAWGSAKMAIDIITTGAPTGESIMTMLGGTAQISKAVKSDAAEWLKLMSSALSDDAAGLGVELLEKLAEGWNLGRVETTFENLRDKMMGEGFDFGEGGAMNIEMTSDQIKGAVDSLQTALGGFKVEGDGQTRLLQSALNVEEKQLQTSKEILTAITQQGGGALL